MTSPMTVFIVGIFGVFFGMAFLYLSIKATGAVAVALDNRQADIPAAKKAGKKEG